MRRVAFSLWALVAVLTSGYAVAATVPLVNSSDTWNYRKGTNEPAMDWASQADGELDGTWLSGPGGIGYGDGDDGTVLGDMRNNYTTVYIRRSFEIAGPVETNLLLRLRVDFDDGFVAYLDGVEIRRANVAGTPGVPVPFGGTAITDHGSAVDGGAIETYDLGLAAALLAPGIHVLAVQGFNDSAGSSDLSLTVGLFMEEETAPPPPPLVAPGGDWLYHKGTNAPVTGWQTAADATLGVEWLTGPGGFGYGDGDDATVLSDMEDVYTTVYIRRTFEVTEAFPGGLNLVMEMDWDDAFVAYLDGVEVARSPNAGTPAGTEPAHTATATNTREATGQPTVFDLGPADGLPVGTHVLAILGLNESLGSSDFSLIAGLRVGELPDGISGLISADTTWTTNGSPYTVVGSVTVVPGVTLTIEPGVVVEFGGGTGLLVEGRLLAEGTGDARIVFRRVSGGGSWDGIDLDGGALESRISFADMIGSSGNIDASGTRIYLGDMVWSNTSSQLVDATGSSIHIKGCVFPTISGELLHFSNMPSDGYAIIDGNLFGTTAGYNDIIDFTGGNRPGPIVQFLNNIFTAGVDDFLDMDGTDAHIEGNIFMNLHSDSASRSSSANAIATGEGGGETAELTIARNIFYDVEHVLLLKEAASAVFQNNTVVQIRQIEEVIQPPTFINFGEPNRGVTGGMEALVDGTIVWQLNGHAPVNNYTNGIMNLVINHSIIDGTNWPGIGNSQADPMFVSLTDITYENIRSKLALMPGSPAIGTGPNGLDMGALVPAGASISGEPGTTAAEPVTLNISGPGIVAFRYSVNGGPYSDEIAIGDLLAGEPLELSGLTNGSYTVSVIGKNSAGVYQETQAAAVSETFIVSRGLDRDNDGMPDDWETGHGLDPDDPADALLDGDGDGISNLDEYRSGTDPEDPESVLKVASAAVSGAGVELRFTAVEGRTYTVEYRETLTGGSWVKLEDVLAQGMTGEVTVMDPDGGVERYYRLVTPALP